jgi:hypothetical protein
MQVMEFNQKNSDTGRVNINTVAGSTTVSLYIYYEYKENRLIPILTF